VFFLIPAAARDSMACGVISRLALRIASEARACARSRPGSFGVIR
jgi:hypothetical protein